MIPPQGSRYISPIDPKGILEGNHILTEITGEVDPVVAVEPVTGFCIQVVKIEFGLISGRIGGEFHEKVGISPPGGKHEGAFVLDDRTLQVDAGGDQSDTA